MSELGWDEFFAEQFAPTEFADSFPARVISQQAYVYTLMSQDGEHTAGVTGRFRFLARQSKDYPVVGDFVVAGRASNSDDIVIHKVLARRNYFSRKMPISGGRRLKDGVIDGGTTEEQMIASNLDTVFIVCGLDGNFSVARIERYLTLITHQRLQAVIILNKLDLCDRPGECIREVESMAAGVPVLAVSALTREGLEQLRSYIAPGKTVAFLGSSGVGKSTLLNSIFGEQVQLTRDISQTTGKGRHTTTSRQLFVHSSGCMIIDTPGMKELQLWANREDLDSVYADVVEIMSRCKFTNCKHGSEAGCAVRAALDDGTLSAERYARYLTSRRELRRLDEKKAERQRNLVKRARAR